MSRCTCSTDKEVTCIVHPTDRSLKDRIQKLENRVEKWKRYWDEADRRGDSLEAQLAAERERYQDLIMQVQNKIPGESRHETARRIIRQHENQCQGPAMQATAPEQEGE